MSADIILELWRTGAYSADEVVEAAKCSHLHFRQVLKTNGFEMPPASVGLHFEIYNEHQAGNEAYDSTRAVAKMYDMWASTAYKYCKEAPTYKKSKKDTDAAMAAALTNGFSVKEVAEAFNVHPNTVYSLRTNLDGVKPTRKGKLTDEDRNAIRELLAKGVEQNTIAEQFGVTPSMISYLKPNRIAKPHGAKLDDEDWAQVKAELKRYSISEVARMHNISRARIYAKLAKEEI